MLILKDVLTKQEVRDALAVLERTPFESRRKASEQGGAPAELIKNNLELRPTHPDIKPTADLITTRMLGHFEFSSYAMPRLMRFLFNRYEADMFYGRHVDTALVPRSQGEMMRLDVSFSVFLSDPDDYEGGDFVVELPYGEKHIRGEAGGAIVYPSDTLHWVEPVIRGARTSVVGWIQSLIPDPTERQIHFDLSLVLKELFETVDRDQRRRLENVRERLLRRWVQT